VVQDRLTRLRAKLESVHRIEVGRRKLVIRLGATSSELEAAALPASDQLTDKGDEAILTISATMKWRGGAKLAIGPEGAPAVQTARIDLPLLRALIRAETWKQRLSAGGISLNAIADEEQVNRAYAQRVVRLAWLSPELKRAVLDGKALARFTLSRLLQEDIPLVWTEQRRWACNGA
jgi:hypothetical protein